MESANTMMEVTRVKMPPKACIDTWKQARLGAWQIHQVSGQAGAGVQGVQLVQRRGSYVRG